MLVIKVVHTERMYQLWLMWMGLVDEIYLSSISRPPTRWLDWSLPLYQTCCVVALLGVRK